MNMCRLVRWSAVFVSLACLSATATAAEYYEPRLCDGRDLYNMHPGNLNDNLYSMSPTRESGYMYSGDLTLHRLVRNGETEAIKELLEAGLDPNPVNDHGLTPLTVATALGHTDIMRILLDAGVDPNWTSKNEYYPCMATPLHWAAYLGHTNAVTALLEGGADKNAATKNGETPINWANAAGRGDILLLLLKSGKTSDSGQGSKKIVVPE